MEYVIAALVAAWVLNLIYQGYKNEMAPPLPMVDNGHGAKEPICPTCAAKLVTVTRKGGIGLTGVIGWLVLFSGLLVLLAINWLAGGGMLIVGILLVILGKSTETVLTCPACGKDAKRLV